MNTNIITLSINDQNYYIHEHYLKRCRNVPKESIKLKYPAHIINTFFEILYDNYESMKTKYNIADILSLYEIY